MSNNNTFNFGVNDNNQKENKPLFGINNNINKSSETKNLFPQSNANLFNMNNQTNINSNLSNNNKTELNNQNNIFNLNQQSTSQTSSSNPPFGNLNNTPNTQKIPNNQNNKNLNQNDTSNNDNNNNNNNTINTSSNQNDPNKKKEDQNKLNIKSPEQLLNDIIELDQMTIAALEKKTIEEAVNSWNNTLEQQQSKMSQLTDKFQILDLQLNSCFDSVREIMSYREKLQNNSNSTLNKLKDINETGDQMIAQLEFMHRKLKRTLDNVSQLPNGDNKDGQFYNNINTISEKVNEIGNDIEEMNDKLQDKGNNNLFNKRNEYGYDVEDQDSNDKLYVNDNEINEILNSFYLSLMSIKNMEQDLNNRLKKVQEELNEKNNDNNYHNYNEKN
jgi:hypothetical protein